MTTRMVPVGDTLDDAVDSVWLVAAPWAGILALTALPLRFAQVRFVDTLLQLGPAASRHGDLLTGQAWLIVLLLVPALLGRAVFVRACALSVRTGRGPGREVLRVPLSSLIAYLYLALLAEAAFCAFAVTFVAIPCFLVLAGLSAAALPIYRRAGLVAPLRDLVRQLEAWGTLLALCGVFAAGLLVTFVNLYVVFRIALWAWGAFPATDTGDYQAWLRLDQPRFVLVLIVGAVSCVEPFWLAALSSYVHRLGSRSNGEDLRLGLLRLRRERA